MPADIQERLKSDFGSWKIQGTEDLSESARKTLAGKKPQSCPGVAVGLFQSATATSYALLLVPVEHPNRAYRLMVFSHRTGQASYEAVVVEKSDDQGASNYFIRKVDINDFFNEESRRRFHVQTKEAILMVDSAEQEYQADIYFYSDNRFQHQPVDD